jgi:hypothetical protein
VETKLFNPLRPLARGAAMSARPLVAMLVNLGDRYEDASEVIKKVIEDLDRDYKLYVICQTSGPYSPIENEVFYKNEWKKFIEKIKDLEEELKYLKRQLSVCIVYKVKEKEDAKFKEKYLRSYHVCSPDYLWNVLLSVFTDILYMKEHEHLDIEEFYLVNIGYPVAGQLALEQFARIFNGFSYEYGKPIKVKRLTYASYRYMPPGYSNFTELEKIDGYAKKVSLKQGLLYFPELGFIEWQETLGERGKEQLNDKPPFGVRLATMLGYKIVVDKVLEKKEHFDWGKILDELKGGIKLAGNEKFSRNIIFINEDWLINLGYPSKSANVLRSLKQWAKESRFSSLISDKSGRENHSFSLSSDGELLCKKVYELAERYAELSERLYKKWYSFDDLINEWEKINKSERASDDPILEPILREIEKESEKYHN